MKTLLLYLLVTIFAVNFALHFWFNCVLDVYIIALLRVTRHL